MIKKIKNYLYQNPPASATRKEWNEWNKKAKKNKIRWFLFKTFPLWFKSTFIWPVERAKDWIFYRTIRDYRKIKAHSLKPGYYDKDSLMLHCMFDLLADLIEIEKALRQNWDEEKKQSFWHKIKYKFTEFRNRELGLKHLDWEISLADPNSPDFDKQLYEHESFTTKWKTFEEFKASPDFKTTQSFMALEQKALYLWWKDIRPKRIDSHDIKGELGFSWSDYCEMMRKKYPDDFFFEEKTDEEAKISSSALKISRKTEEKYDKEDEEMLIRLVKIRQSFWT